MYAGRCALSWCCRWYGKHSLFLRRPRPPVHALVSDTAGPLRHLLTWQRVRVTTPERLSTARHVVSKSARDVSYNPEHHDRMKHVQRRHFFVRDMVESFELEVPFVRTADNLADILTKPMSDAKQFHKLRKLIMNDDRD